MPNNDDIWSQLLGAAKKEDEKKNGASAPEKQPEATAAEDPWSALLGAAREEASRQAEEPAAGTVGPYQKGSVLLDTYRIESDPIEGGMGSVWRVRHTGWNVDLAMKRPQAKMFANESSKQGFIDECRNWINLGLHPNIVSCYYVREIDGVPAIFSEWMENGDLEHHIQKGTLYDGTEEELQARLLDIAIQYARGLHYAHEQGLIHQDVKPANLLLTNDWQAKAADFGLANARAQLTVLEGDTTQQDAGQSLNAAAGGYTPAYCSMEQMDGKSLTRRTDIYSWAVSVMEMYIGSRPWQNGVVAGAGCRDYMAMEDCRVKMPEDLQDLLARCMEMHEQDRPHDFAEVEAELIRIYGDITGGAYLRPVPRAAPDTADSLNNRALSYLDLEMPEEAEKTWRQAIFSDPANLPAVFNSTVYALRRGDIHGGQAQANLAQVYQATDRGMDCLIRLDMEIGPEAYDHARDLAKRLGDPDVTDEMEDAIRNGGYRCPYLLSRIRELPETLRTEKKYETRASELRSLANSGQYAEAAIEMEKTAAGDRDYLPCLYRPEWMALSEAIGRHGLPLYMPVQFQLLNVPETFYEDDVSFDSGSTRFLCGGRLYDLKTGEMLADHRPAGVKACYSRLSPDGTFLLRGRYDENTFEKIDALTGRSLGRFGGFSSHLCTLAISPDGTSFAACDHECVFRMWTNGKEVFAFQSQADPACRIWISPDNRQVLFTNWNCSWVCIGHVSGAMSRIEQLDFDFRELWDIAVSADFSTMVVCGGDEGYLLYDLKQRRTILRENGQNTEVRVKSVRGACMLPNDRFYAYISTNRIWFFSPRLQESFGVVLAGTAISKVAVSSDWKYIAYTGTDGAARLLHASYVWYVPPVNFPDPDWGRFSFFRWYWLRFDPAGDPQAVLRNYGMLKDVYEAAYSDASVLPAYARTLRGRYPEASEDELFRMLKDELAKRGFCLFTEPQIRGALVR